MKARNETSNTTQKNSLNCMFCFPNTDHFDILNRISIHWNFSLGYHHVWSEYENKSFINKLKQISTSVVISCLDEFGYTFERNPRMDCVGD